MVFSRLNCPFPKYSMFLIETMLKLLLGSYINIIFLKCIVHNNIMENAIKCYLLVNYIEKSLKFSNMKPKQYSPLVLESKSHWNHRAVFQNSSRSAFSMQENKCPRKKTKPCYKAFRKITQSRNRHLNEFQDTLFQKMLQLDQVCG